MLLKILNLHSN